jgi:hypothetical protein
MKLTIWQVILFSFVSDISFIVVYYYMFGLDGICK